jgi:dinuclear metal center YbgI/SA1388 family protein
LEKDFGASVFSTKATAMNIEALLAMLNKQMMPEQFSDAAPNGLQVAGQKTVAHILCAVSASQAVIEEAIFCGADTLLVHHGYFWKNESRLIVGIQKTRIQTLLAHNLNLIAYHLPLDAHPKMGNNKMLAQKLNWKVEGQIGLDKLLWHGKVKATPLEAFLTHLNETLKTTVTSFGQARSSIRKIAWCTGAGQHYFHEAIMMGVDAFITGEICEQHYHLAQESGVPFIRAGHHATERYGIEALGNWIQKITAIQVTHSQQNNPI